MRAWLAANCPAEMRGPMHEEDQFYGGRNAVFRNEAQKLWLERMEADQQAFHYLWWTDHLGASSFAGQAVTLPLPVLMNDEAAQATQRSLELMRRVVPRVGFENSVSYFVPGDPLAEPAFIQQALGKEGWLVLDLHNVHTMAVNLGFEPEAYLARLDLDRVLELPEFVAGDYDTSLVTRDVNGSATASTRNGMPARNSSSGRWRTTPK